MKLIFTHKKRLDRFVKNRTVGIASEYTKDLERYSNLLHEATLQTFLNEDNATGLVICDEFQIRLLFLKEQKILSVSSFHLIHYLYRKNKMTFDMYNRCLYKLVTFGYEFIPFNASVLLQALKDYDFDPSNIFFRSLIESLKSPATTPYSAKKVLWYFWNFPLINLLSADKREKIHEFIKDLLS